MNITEVITGRRTIKKFKQDSINMEKIITWFNVARFAPNHRMTEPWEIIIIGPETRAKLNHKMDFGNAPVLFAVLSKKGKTEVEREENIAATACFVQNFMLLAWEDGLGTFWSSIATSPKNKELLSVGEDKDVVGVFAVGYPEEVPTVKERALIETKITHLL